MSHTPPCTGASREDPSDLELFEVWEPDEWDELLDGTLGR
jgi:hypothetical protein